MSILVTGGAGYIGSHTIVELHENTDEEVISIDNFSNSGPEVYERIKEITGIKVNHYPVDLCNATETEEVFKANKNIKGIIHFAAHKSVPESVENPFRYYRNNITSLINILEFQKKYGIPYFIFSSSCSVYGNAKDLPVTESSAADKAESPYAATKIMGEQVTKDVARHTTGLKAVSLRYFNPAGAHPSGLIGEIPKDRPSNLVPAITRFAAGKSDKFVVYGNDYDTRDGTCIRDYIHVSDIAEAHVLALQHLENNRKVSDYDIFNLGTGDGITVREVIRAFERCSGMEMKYETGPRREGDVEAIYANNDKASEILNWHPGFSLEQIVKTAWNWEKNID